MPSNQHRKNIIKLMRENAHRHQLYDVFRDFVEMAALAISNSADLLNREAREERYLAIAKRYNAEEMARFPQMLGELTMGLEVEPCDMLGQVFHELEMSSAERGQFFTPYHLCEAIARLAITDDEALQEAINRRGFITVSEPACGAGAMVIALSQALRERGHNYQQCLHVTAIDVDSRAVHMAYLQFSLLGIPALIIEGDALTLEERDHWYTPAHIMGMWDVRLNRGYALGSAMDEGADPDLQELPAPPVPEPIAIPRPAAARYEEQIALF